MLFIDWQVVRILEIIWSDFFIVKVESWGLAIESGILVVSAFFPSLLFPVPVKAQYPGPASADDSCVHRTFICVVSLSLVLASSVVAGALANHCHLSWESWESKIEDAAPSSKPGRSLGYLFSHRWQWSKSKCASSHLVLPPSWERTKKASHGTLSPRALTTLSIWY